MLQKYKQLCSDCISVLKSPLTILKFRQQYSVKLSWLTFYILSSHFFQKNKFSHFSCFKL